MNQKSVKLRDLKTEEGADELVNSPDMRPYVRLAMAAMQETDIQPHVKEIMELPLDKRYIWRVASALKWGFADFDNVNVAVDRRTLPPEDLATVMELLKHRPIQFCLFLKALVGLEEMERVMTEALTISKQDV